MFGTLIRITISVTVIVGNTAMLNLVEKRQFPHFSTGETGAHAELNKNVFQ